MIDSDNYEYSDDSPEKYGISEISPFASISNPGMMKQQSYPVIKTISKNELEKVSSIKSSENSNEIPALKNVPNIEKHDEIEKSDSDSINDILKNEDYSISSSFGKNNHVLVRNKSNERILIEKGVIPESFAVKQEIFEKKNRSVEYESEKFESDNEGEIEYEEEYEDDEEDYKENDEDDKEIEQKNLSIHQLGKFSDPYNPLKEQDEISGNNSESSKEFNSPFEVKIVEENMMKNIENKKKLLDTLIEAEPVIDSNNQAKMNLSIEKEMKTNIEKNIEKEIQSEKIDEKPAQPIKAEIEFENSIYSSNNSIKSEKFDDLEYVENSFSSKKS